MQLPQRNFTVAVTLCGLSILDAFHVSTRWLPTKVSSDLPRNNFVALQASPSWANPLSYIILGKTNLQYNIGLSTTTTTKAGSKSPTYYAGSNNNNTSLKNYNNKNDNVNRNITLNIRNDNRNVTIHKNVTSTTNKKSSLFGQHTFNASKNESRVASLEENVTKSYYGSLLDTYFPFWQSSASSSAPSTSTIKKYSLDRNGIKVSKKVDVQSILKDKHPNDTITVQDLRNIISHFQLSSVDAGILTSSQRVNENNSGSRVSSDVISTRDGIRRKTSQVAFPQPSILSYRDLQRGTSTAGGILGMILGATIFPNLWLVGLVLGAVYGYDIAKEPLPNASGQVYPQDHHVLARFLISLGRKLAKTYLQIYDYWKTLWFLYKTGQLSYEYYKRYEMLDSRFSIQDKVDAWNRRFAEGKRKFDAWEEQNEVGRTILAGIRTVWLVDEQSRRRTRKKSRYRLVQYLYDIKYFLSRSLRRFRVWIQSMTNSENIREFIAGLRADLANEGSVGARFGAVVAAIIAVNIGGAIFSISGTFANILAVAMAVIWPTWTSDIFSRLRQLGAETQARGRGDNVSSSSLPSLSSTFDTPNFMRRYDRNRYHYFVRPNGAKRYYRTGQSMAPSVKGRGQRKTEIKKTRFASFWSSKTENQAKTEGNFWDRFRI